MKKIKQILINKFTLGLIFGVLCFYALQTLFREPQKEIKYLGNFELNQTLKNYLSIRGTYAVNKELVNVLLECDLNIKTCTESTFNVSTDGIAGLGVMNTYQVIEATPSKIIAQLEGLGAIHSYIIELDKNVVTFKSQSKQNSSDVDFYVLENGMDTLKKISK